MKKTILTFAIVLMSANVFAENTCSNKEGSLSYESATTMGDKVVIVNPRLNVAGTAVSISKYTVTNSYVNTHSDSGDYLCKAFGLKSGKTTDSTHENTTKLVADFNGSGVLEEIRSKLYIGEKLINILICQK